MLLYGDIGGFGVGSDLTSQAIAGVNRKLSKHDPAQAGYRYLYQEFEKHGFVCVSGRFNCWLSGSA